LPATKQIKNSAIDRKPSQEKKYPHPSSMPATTREHTPDYTRREVLDRTQKNITPIRKSKTDQTSPMLTNFHAGPTQKRGEKIAEPRTLTQNTV
jgi:hypothetical protein